MASLSKTLWPAAALLAICTVRPAAAQSSTQSPTPAATRATTQAAAQASAQAAAQANALKPDQAEAHIGERITVCGLVASTKYLATTNKLTLLNFDRPYPNQTLTAVIYPDVRAKFSQAPDSALKEKQVCATGAVTLYRDKAQLVISAPQDIVVQK